MLNRQEQELLTIIRNDIAARNIFFTKIEDGRYYFPLKQEGYFDASTIPEAIEVDGGHQFPYWAPVGYLQKLAAKTTQGEYLDLVEDILTVVEDATQQIVKHQLLNKRPYVFFVDILAKVPNEKISLDYLHGILPLWLSVGDAFYTSPEIVQRLIPKFLNDPISDGDREKSEFILRSVLEHSLYPVTSIEKKNLNQRFNRSLYWLNETIVKQEFHKKIAALLDTEIVFYIADQIKIIIWNSSARIERKFEYLGKEFDFVLIPRMNQGLYVTLHLQSDVEFTITELDKLDDVELFGLILSKTQEHGLETAHLEDFGDKLRKAIRFGVSSDSSIFKSQSFFDPDDVDRHDDVEESFVTYLQKISESVTDLDVVRGNILIKAFLSNTYRTPIFKRLAVYLIARNWQRFSDIFWSLVTSGHAVKLFSEFHLNSELYNLLNRNVSFLSDNEVTQLQEIFIKAQSEDKTEEQNEFARFRWVSALRTHPQLKLEYERLSARFSETHTYFEESQKVRVRVGDASPFTSAEIIKMGFPRLMDEIRDFKSDKWLGPSARGFANSIEQAVIEQPEKFALELNWFLEVPYVYAHGLLSGFQTAWKNKKAFDWNLLLSFCSRFITSEKFISGQLVVDDGNWDYKADWIDGIIGNLITEGIQVDENAFPLELMPKAEEILSLIIHRQPSSDMERVESSDMDYPMFAINTTQGKVYRALLDCALRNKRNGVVDVWPTTEKPLFIAGLAKGTLEIDVFIGWHIRQFYFLDKDWVDQYVDNLSLTQFEPWKAFMGGYLFPNPINSIETYRKLLPHYMTAISISFAPKNTGGINRGLTRHVACAYFWAYDSGGLINHFIDSSDQAQLSDLIHFLATQRDYLKELSPEEKEEFRARMLDLWRYLLRNLRLRNDQSFYPVAAESADIIVYFDDLTTEVQVLVNDSFSFQGVKNEAYFVLEHLFNLLAEHNTKQNATGAAAIFLKMLQSYIPRHEENQIREFINALYQQADAKILTNEICDVYLKNGIEFLRDIRSKYNS